MERHEQIEARLQAIQTEMEAPDADLDALLAETRSLTEELRGINAAAEKRNRLRQAVADGTGMIVRDLKAAAPQPKAYGAGSPEYRRAFLKNLLDQELDKEERAAFVHTTSTSGAVLPTTMLDTIWDLIAKTHTILGDITIYRTGTILEVVKHTAVTQGAAKTVAENAANDDEQNTFIKVTLSGKDFSKHVDISYAMERMSIDALEAYLVNEISAGIGEAMAADVVTQIGKDMTTGNKVNSTKVKELTYKEVAALFGKLKRVGAVTVYATRATIYNYLVGMVDTTGRPIFQPSAQAGQEGTILGARIRVEDAVADNVLLAGDPKRVVYNMIQDILLESDKDIKKHVTTHSGYARGEGALIDADSFAQLTITQA